MKNRAILNDANLTAEQKKKKFAEAEAARREKYIGTDGTDGRIDKLSRPVERYLDREADEISDSGSEMESGPEDQLPEEPIGQNLDNNQPQNETAEDSETGQELAQQEKFRETEGTKPEFEEGAGKSLDITKKKSLAESAGEGATEQGKTAVKGEAKQAAKQVVNQAINAAKKAAAQAVKKIAMSLAANPYFWIVVGCIVVAIIIFVIIFSMYASMANQSPNPNGGSIVRTVDPVADKNWIKKLLQFTGNKDIQTKITDELLQGLTADLASLANDSNVSADTKTKITAANEAIKLFNPSSPDNTKALAIVAAIKAVLNSYWYVPTFPGGITTQYPFKPTTLITDYNNHSHLGTPANPCGAGLRSCELSGIESTYPAHTFIQYEKNTCDGVDLNTPKGGNTPVYPIFAGEVKMDGPKSGIWVERDEGQDKYIAVYAHLDSKVKVGEKVSLETQLGTVIEEPGKTPHMHFEVSVNSHCVVTSPAEGLDLSTKNPQHPGYGKFLWDKMRGVLRLN